MSPVQRRSLPEHALLAKFARRGAYTDCYVTAVPRNVTHAEFVEAFYTSWLFKLERLILTWFAEKPSTDPEARALSRGDGRRAQGVPTQCRGGRNRCWK